MKLLNFNGEEVALTIGKFGVLHRGHEDVLKNLIEVSEERNLRPAILSFYPSPALFFSRNFEKCGRIQKYSSIWKILECAFPNKLAFFLQKFGSEFSKLSPESFVEFLSINLNVKHIIVGENFFFGKDRSGSVSDLKILCKKYKIDLTVQRIASEISTTIMRKMLFDGEIKKFNSLLAFRQKYLIEGVVSRGFGMAGKNLGFKTANVFLPGGIVSPKFGVYFCAVHFGGKKLKAIVNIGIKPTFEIKTRAVAEVHIFDFDEEIYDKKIKIELEDFIRPEQKFLNIAELKRQIATDIELLRKTYL